MWNNNNKKGFYTGEYLIEDNSSNNKYEYTVQISEIERYNNGYSKIKINKIEVTNGFELSNYRYIKKCIKADFSTLKLTNDIVWLEPQNSLKKERLIKLNKLNNKFFNWIR